MESMVYDISVPETGTIKNEGRSQMTNSKKLKGRIIEKGYTLSSFSDAIKMSRPCFRKRVNGESDFKSKEIEKICDLLDISRADMVEYFFDS